MKTDSILRRYIGDIVYIPEKKCNEIEGYGTIYFRSFDASLEGCFVRRGEKDHREMVGKCVLSWGSEKREGEWKDDLEIYYSQWIWEYFIISNYKWRKASKWASQPRLNFVSNLPTPSHSFPKNFLKSS